MTIALIIAFGLPLFFGVALIIIQLNKIEDKLDKLAQDNND